MADTIKPNQAGIGKKPKGSGFTNISKMLDANKNNQLGSTVASGVSGTADKAKSTLAGAQQDFQSGLVSNRIGDDDEKSLVAQGMDAAKSGQVSDQLAQGFARIQGGYKGPTSLKDEEAVSAQAQSAQALGQNTQSRGGRQELLARFAARPQASYTQGQKRLDELLLGQTGAKDIQAARRQTVGLADQATAATAQARLAAGKEANDARTYAEDVKKQLNDSAEGVKTIAKTSAGTAQAMQEDLGALARGEISYDAYVGKHGNSSAAQNVNAILKNSSEGLTSGAGQFLTSGDVIDTASGSQFLTPEMAANLNALAKLSGDPTSKYAAGSYKGAEVDTEKYVNENAQRQALNLTEQNATQLAEQQAQVQQLLAGVGYDGKSMIDAEARKAQEFYDSGVASSKSGLSGIGKISAADLAARKKKADDYKKIMSLENSNKQRGQARYSSDDYKDRFRKIFG